MQAFDIGEMVIINGSESRDSEYAHYFHGSVGRVSQYSDSTRTYGVDLDVVVDAQPDDRIRNGYDLDNLNAHARYTADQLEPYEGTVGPDPEFEHIFD